MKTSDLRSQSRTELKSALEQQKQQLASLKSAKVTGDAHWHVLQRARAIETGCYVISAAQTCEHAEGRRTYGHSVIVDPWGRVVADAGEEVGVITAEIDLAEVAAARAKVPSLTHDRPVGTPTVYGTAFRQAGE